MDLIIRDIQKEDFDSVFELLSLYKKYKNFDKNFYSKHDLINEVLSDDKYVKLFVAAVASEIVGFIFFNESFDITGKSIFIEDNFVLEKYRGNKIGTSLFSKVLGYGLKNNIEKIKWNLSIKDPFISIYKEIGATFLNNIETYFLTKEKMLEISKKKIDFDSDLFTIRSVKNRDLPAIKFFMEDVDHASTNFLNIDIYDLLKYGLGKRQLFKMLLVEVNDEIIALITYFDYFSALYGKSSHVQYLFVHDKYKSIGIEKIIKIYLINSLSKNKYNYLTIDVYNKDIAAKKRMQFYGAKLLDDGIIIEMSNDSIKKLIDIG